MWSDECNTMINFRALLYIGQWLGWGCFGVTFQSHDSRYYKPENTTESENLNYFIKY